MQLPPLGPHVAPPLPPTAVPAEPPVLEPPVALAPLPPDPAAPVPAPPPPVVVPPLPDVSSSPPHAASGKTDAPTNQNSFANLDIVAPPIACEGTRSFRTRQKRDDGLTDTEARCT